MELPKNHKTWTQLAKECVIIEKEHLGAKEVKFVHKNKYGKCIEFSIGIIEAKAKAFDEILSKGQFSNSVLRELFFILRSERLRFQGKLAQELSSLSDVLELLSKDDHNFRYH